MNKNDFIKKYNLVELNNNKNIIIDLIYSTENNFTHQKLYENSTCLLRKKTSEKLLLANEEFNKYGYKIKIWDAFRPIKFQRKMWEVFPNRNFVTNPSEGKSNHCKGSAVDITLCTLDGIELEMPTKFDHFGKESFRCNYNMLPKNIQENVNLLENIMIKHGFNPYPFEWWHFNDSDNYEIIYDFFV